MIHLVRLYWWCRWRFWHLWDGLKQAVYCWRYNVVRCGEAVCVRSIRVAGKDELLLDGIGGMAFAEDVNMCIRARVDAGAEVVVTIENLTKRPVPVAGALFGDEPDGTQTVLPLPPAVLGPKESMRFVIRVQRQCMIQRLFIPPYVRKP